jgi:hypothetical protein
MNSVRMTLLAIGLVALTCAVASAGQATKSVGGQTLTASYDTTSGMVSISITGSGNTIENVQRYPVGGGGWQDVTGFDCKTGTGEEGLWRSLDTALHDLDPHTVHYKVRFKVGTTLYEATASITSDGNVVLSNPVPV